MRVLRVYHGGRDPAHRARDRALVEAGVELTTVVPAQWSEGGAGIGISWQLRRAEHRQGLAVAVRAVGNAARRLLSGI